MKQKTAMTTLRLSDEFARSDLSLGSEDWDRSAELEPPPPTQPEGRVREPSSSREGAAAGAAPTTPRNSIVFPADAQSETPRGRETRARDGAVPKRTLSDLLRMYAEKGTELRCSPEEAASVGRVLGQWINSSASPYEDDDDFFVHVAQDDLALGVRRTPVTELRPRGQSESIVPPRSPQPVAASS